MWQVALVVLLIAVLTTVVVAQEVQQRKSNRRAAATLFEQYTALFAGEHEYIVVPDGSSTVPRRGAYGDVHAACLAAGLRPLGSFENLTVSRALPAHRTVLASYVHPNGFWGIVTFAAGDAQVTEAGAATTDGRYIVTTNARLGFLEFPPEVERHPRPECTAAEIIAAHAARMSEVAREQPSTRFIFVQTIEDAIRISKAHSRRMSEFRRSIGYLTLDEMMEMTTRTDQERAARRIWSQFSKLVREQGRGAA